MRSKKDTTEPVYAPVPGKGIATSKISPIHPYFVHKVLFALCV